MTNQSFPVDSASTLFAVGGKRRLLNLDLRLIRIYNMLQFYINVVVIIIMNTALRDVAPPKKRENVGIFPKWGTPPPRLGTPCL